MPWRSTSSASENASCRLTRLSVISSSRSLGITISVSTASLSCSMPALAVSSRTAPSQPNGRVTTPMVNASISLAMRATTDEAPVPVPPPMPAVMNTMSEPCSTSYRSSVDSSAALRPISASPPTPNPRVSLSPMRTRVGASASMSAWASVLIATKSTPLNPSAIMRLTALVPPPPTPTTRICAKLSVGDDLGILLLLSVLRDVCCCVVHNA